MPNSIYHRYTIFSTHNVFLLSTVSDEQDMNKLVCMLKLPSRINAVSAVLDCRSKGCSREEVSDHCKITGLVISGLGKKKRVGSQQLQYNSLVCWQELYRWQDLGRHMEHSILLEKYIFGPKMVLWKHADSQEGFNSSTEYRTKVF